MSLIPAGLVSGPSLVPQPPLIPPVSAAQPVDTASQSKTDSGTSQQRDGASAFLSQKAPETRLTYERPAPVEAAAPPSVAQGFVSESANSGTATADAAAVNAPLAQAEPQKTSAHAVAAGAYSMVADASPGMPASVLTPLRGF